MFIQRNVGGACDITVRMAILITMRSAHGVSDTFSGRIYR